jgi:hypothetical protein
MDVMPARSSTTPPTGETQTPPAQGKRPRLIALALTLLVLVALVPRLHATWQRSHQASESQPLCLVGDENDYEKLARDLLQGSFFQWPGRVPVYPMFIAATYYVLGERSPEKLLTFQALVGASAVLLTFLLARMLTGVVPSLAAATIVALDNSLIDHARMIYAEVLYTPLLLISLLALLWALKRPRLGRFACAGASMAVVTLCRPTSVLIPLLLPFMLPRVWSSKQKVRAFLVYGLAMAAVIAPWTYHNWREYGRFLPLSVSVGAMWQGSPEFYHMAQSGRSHLDIWAKELNPKLNGGHDPFTIEGDRYFNQRGIRSIQAEPLVYLEYSLKKAVYLWLGNPAAEVTYLDLYDWRALREWGSYSSLKLGSMFVTGQMPIVALAALLFLGVRKRLRPVVPFILVCGYFTLMHMITWSESRYSGPLHPLLAIIIVVAVKEALDLFNRTPDIHS